MSPLDTIQRLYAGFASADLPAVLAGMAPDIEWTEAEGYPYAGTFHGPQAIVDGVFIRLATEWEGYQAVPDRYVSEGDEVIALGHYSGTYKATGKSFRAPSFMPGRCGADRSSASCSMSTRCWCSAPCSPEAEVWGLSEPARDRAGHIGLSEPVSASPHNPSLQGRGIFRALRPGIVVNVSWAGMHTRS